MRDVPREGKRDLSSLRCLEARRLSVVARSRPSFHTRSPFFPDLSALFIHGGPSAERRDPRQTSLTPSRRKSSASLSCSEKNPGEAERAASPSFFSSSSSARPRLMSRERSTSLIIRHLLEKLHSGRRCLTALCGMAESFLRGILLSVPYEWIPMARCASMYESAIQ